MSESRKLRVFLCHSSQDKPIVRELYQRLSAEGWIDPWLDEEKLLPGQDWDMEIEKAVEAADAVVVCLSNSSVTKEGYVQRELKFALEIALEKPEGTIFIIPLRLDDCQIPRRLREWQYVDIFPSSNQDFAYKRLLESLSNRAKVNADVVVKLMLLENEKNSILIQNEISEETAILDELKVLQSRIFYRSFRGKKMNTDKLWESQLPFSKLFLFWLISFVLAFLVFFVGMIFIGIIIELVFPNALSVFNTEPNSLQSVFTYILTIWPPALVAFGVFSFTLQKFYDPVINKLIDVKVDRIKSLNKRLVRIELDSKKEMVKRD